MLVSPKINVPFRLPPLEQKFKMISYSDDLKPAISKRDKFQLIDRAVNLFEKASGCLHHREPKSMKGKILLLGKWKKVD